MVRSFVLMTALPPTHGHLDLIKFASMLTGKVSVVLCTQPDEPMYDERASALVRATKKISKDVVVHHIHQEIPQEPEGNPGFWDMWRDFLYLAGFKPGDYIVASELYGRKLAEVARGKYMPYDLGRMVRYTKATEVRGDWFTEWDQMIPEFRFFLQKKVTIFGAESTGKTTLTRNVGNAWGSSITQVPEWARPYLEAVGPELNAYKMDDIHQGQKALQKSVYKNALSPIVLQDTDLFSTLGFWRNWDEWSMPGDLEFDARRYASDLYVVTPSNIPFEADPLRYGGDKRELPDQYWIDLLEEFELPYVVLDSQDEKARIRETIEHLEELVTPNPLSYQRIGKEYEAQA